MSILHLFAGTAIVAIRFSAFRRWPLERLDHADGDLGSDPGVGRLGRVTIVDEDQVPGSSKIPARSRNAGSTFSSGRVANFCRRPRGRSPQSPAYFWASLRSMGPAPAW